MKKGRHYSEYEISIITQSVLSKSFRDIKDSSLVEYDAEKMQKGKLGDLIEQGLFGIDANIESEPDFIDAGIELKVTPYKKNKDYTLSAKERLVLNMIDFDNEYKNQFETSHFWFKNNKLQIIWYLYEKDKDKLDFKITHEKLLNLALSEDLKQIKDDWYTIIAKIKAGKAHEISEGDTMYLGACPKGANSNDVRKQPFSEIKAMRRAFCFKQSYMTQLVRKYIGDYSNVEKILIEPSKKIMEYVNDVVSKYVGMTQTELKELFNMDSNAKNINGMIASRMFNVKGSLSDTEEFMKANIVCRSVRVEKNGRIKESFPFPTFKYTDIAKEEWVTSEFRNMLETNKYMFFVFANNGDDYVFNGIKLWNMPETDIEMYAKKVWIKTKNVILNGEIVKEVDSNGCRITNFPGMSDNLVCHVRPHAQNAADTYVLPVRDKITGVTEYTKHCFWLNNKYIEKVLKDIIEN